MKPVFRSDISSLFYYTACIFIIIIGLVNSNQISSSSSQLLTINQPVQISQSQSLIYYNFSISDQQSTYTIVLSIESQQLGEYYPIMAVKNQQYPHFQQDDGSVKITSYDYTDWNSHNQNKNQHTILLTPDLLDTFDSQEWFIGIFIDNNAFLQYTIEIKDQTICPNNCNGQGCQSGICICQQNYIDYDCSKFAISIQIGELLSTTINNSQQSYYYSFSSTGLETTQQLKVSINTILQNSNITNYYIIPSNLSYQIYYLTHSSLSSSQQIENKLYTIFRYLYSSTGTLIAQYLEIKQNLASSEEVVETNILMQKEDIYKYSNSSYEQFQFQDYNFSKKSDRLLPIILSVGLSILVVFPCCIYARSKFRYYRRNRELEEQERHLEQSQDHIDIELVNKCMPVMSMQEFMKDKAKVGSIRQIKIVEICQSCCICLGEFQHDDQIRKLICGHVFHKDCIDTWLLQCCNCPYCRQTFSSQELTEFKKKQKSRIKANDCSISMILGDDKL